MRHSTKPVTLPVVLLLLLLPVAGCDRDRDTPAGVAARPIAAITNSVREAPSLTLFEGLPHQMLEENLFNNEMSRKRTVQLHGFAFYEQTQAVESQDESKLKALLSSGQALIPHPPNVYVMKQCGGFHPDYAVRWTVKGQVYDVLFCFGCEEAKAYGADGEVPCDISEAALKELRSILTPYRRERPTGQPG